MGFYQFMMTTIKIQVAIEESISGAEVIVHGDDGVHFDAIVIAPQFDGMSKVKRQQLVYQALNHFILDGSLHAIALKTHTPTEWTVIKGTDKE